MNIIEKNNSPVDENRFLFPFLLELRLRLFYCIAVFLFLFCLLSFFSVRLYQCLAQPLLNQFSVKNQLISTSLTAPLFVPLKFTLKLAIFFSMPFLFYQFWLFVAPALYFKERRLLWLVLTVSIGLFYTGVFFAYQFILPFLIKFFFTLSPNYVHLLPDISHYLDFCLQLIFDFGLIFELPLLVVVIVIFGFLNLSVLVKCRRYFIVLSFIVAMLLTPPDVVAQTLLALPLCLLFEIALLICRFIPERYVGSLQQ